MKWLTARDNLVCMWEVQINEFVIHTVKKIALSVKWTAGFSQPLSISIKSHLRVRRSVLTFCSKSENAPLWFSILVSYVPPSCLWKTVICYLASHPHNLLDSFVLIQVISAICECFVLVNSITFQNGQKVCPHREDISRPALVRKSIYL